MKNTISMPNKNGKVAIMQILILLVGTIAIAYAVGSVGGVEGMLKEADRLDTTPIPANGVNHYDRAGVSYVTKSRIQLGGIDIPSDATITSNGDGTYSITGGGTSSINQNQMNQIRNLGEKAVSPEGMTWSGKSFGSGLLTGLKWGFTVGSAILMFGPMFGLEQGQTNALAVASFVGLTMGKGIAEGLGGGTGAGWTGFGVGLAAAYMAYQLTYSEVEYRIVNFNCEPWQAPIGGKYCEACNKQSLSCSEYQCKSLGQACELLNAGTNEESCAWVNRQDVLEPIIEINPSVLSINLSYSNAEAISPPDRGVEIMNTIGEDTCIEPYKAFTFGITTNETARCRMDTVRRNTFEEMRFFIGGSSTFKYNHTHTMALPGAGNGSVELKNDGNYELFIRCEDANGNANTGEFVVQYCIRKGMDTTAPEILGARFGNNMPIAFNSSKLTTQFFTDEEAQCKWAKEDKEYDDMEYNMTNCGVLDTFSNRVAYSCNVTLPGIKDGEANKFYIKCMDQPGNPNLDDRNANVESYIYTVMGTRPLVIESLEPNDTIIKGSTESVKVTLKAQTTAGYSEGTSECASSQNENDGFVAFYNTNSYIHSTDLYLTEGEYDYWIKCVDLGGNEDKEKITFEVDSDSAAPVVIRVYKEEINLRITTDEIATCVYDTKDCTYLYEDGIAMTKTSDELGHYTEWNPQTKLYIKCKDEFGNQPAPDECSIIVKALEK